MRDPEEAGHSGGEQLAPPPGDPVPRRARRGPLQSRERLVVAVWAAVPIVVAALVLVPFAAGGRASAGDVVVAALVYGGLLALATGFVAHDRMQVRQCPRCTSRNERGVTTCASCGYDLEGRPRWRCAQRHEVTVEPGMCSCGRRLQQVGPPRGVGPQVTAVLKAGAWMLAFLVAVGLVLQWIAS